MFKENGADGFQWLVHHMSMQSNPTLLFDFLQLLIGH